MYISTSTSSQMISASQMALIPSSGPLNLKTQGLALIAKHDKTLYAHKAVCIRLLKEE